MDAAICKRGNMTLPALLDRRHEHATCAKEGRDDAARTEPLNARCAGARGAGSGRGSSAEEGRAEDYGAPACSHAVCLQRAEFLSAESDPPNCLGLDELRSRNTALKVSFALLAGGRPSAGWRKPSLSPWSTNSDSTSTALSRSRGVAAPNSSSCVSGMLWILHVAAGQVRVGVGLPAVPGAVAAHPTV